MVHGGRYVVHAHFLPTPEPEVSALGVEGDVSLGVSIASGVDKPNIISLPSENKWSSFILFRSQPGSRIGIHSMDEEQWWLSDSCELLSLISLVEESRDSVEAEDVAVLSDDLMVFDSESILVALLLESKECISASI